MLLVLLRFARDRLTAEEPKSLEVQLEEEVVERQEAWT